MSKYYWTESLPSSNILVVPGDLLRQRRIPMVSMDSHIIAVNIPSAVRRFVEDVDEVWSEFELSRAPDFGLGSWSQVAAGVAGQAVSG